MWSQSLLHQGVCFIWPYRSKYGSTITGVSIPSSSGGVLHVDRQSQLRQSKGSQSLLHQGVCFINTTTNTGGKRHDHDVSIPSSSGGVLHKIGWWRHRDGGIALSQSLLHQGVCFISSRVSTVMASGLSQVSIPSSSGGVLHGKAGGSVLLGHPRCLNPFFIRGCASYDRLVVRRAIGDCLNPFFIRGCASSRFGCTNGSGIAVSIPSSSGGVLHKEIRQT